MNVADEDPAADDDDGTNADTVVTSSRTPEQTPSSSRRQTGSRSTMVNELYSAPVVDVVG